MSNDNEVNYNSRKSIIVKKGDIFTHTNGSQFICIDEDLTSNRPTLQNMASGWTFQAVDVGAYDNGKIDWAYSVGGRFDEQKLNEYLKTHHSAEALYDISTSEGDSKSALVDKVRYGDRSITFSVLSIGEGGTMCRFVTGGFIEDCDDIMNIPEVSEYLEKHFGDKAEIDVDVDIYNIGNGESIDADDKELAVIRDCLDDIINDDACVPLESNYIAIYNECYNDYEDEPTRGR